MPLPTVGRIRGLEQIATPDGRFTILALDQRGSLLRALDLSAEDPATYQILRDFKLAVLDALAEHASAVLLDPQYVAAEAVAAGLVPGDCGLIVSLEKSGYVGEGTARRQMVVPGWSVAKVKRMGASAAKLYLSYHPDSESADHQMALLGKLIAEAHDLDLPLLAEPVSFSLDADVPKKSTAFAAERPALIAEITGRVGAPGPDVLKLEFPHDAAFSDDEGQWLAACEAITERAPVPWTLLSAGVDFDVFRRQVRVACRGGARGFVAGRAIWKEAATLEGADRTRFLREVAAPRLQELAEIVAAEARPWRDHYPNLAEAAGEGWLAGYQA